ncbi:right-handed parallel beta-helix repeat-containing protein [Dethiobacter alkaliphilus]|uniref:hypothetical protein n=1 Tax=Dethiobacter alkaliphilus TaxID=427926 RepID=UPI002225D72B|nr:hypothetical protein [Dethiobacter alkaliphilus]MCW3489385.1 hypothetical protein [Dethiobacter alkaliphilus]
MKRYIVLILLLFTLFTVNNVFALDSSGGLEVTDKGRKQIPNSDVRFVSIVGEGTTDAPYLLLYEDYKQYDDKDYAPLKWTTSNSGEKGFTEENYVVFASQENDGAYGRPSVIQTDSLTGMYLWADGLLYFSEQQNNIWTDPKEVQGIENSQGVIDAIDVDGIIYLYWLDSANLIRVSQSASTDDPFMNFTAGSSVILNELDFSPTGQVVHKKDPDEGDGFFLFFVVEKSYAGLAYSPNGLEDWEIIRGDDDPLLTYEAATENHVRTSLRELTVANGGLTYNMFYTGLFEEVQTSWFGLMSTIEEENSVGFARGRSGTIHVRPGHPGNHAKTIQEAVKAVKTGGQVRVHYSEYNETVTVTRDMTITGVSDGGVRPVIRFAGETGVDIYSKDDNSIGSVTLENLIIDGDRNNVNSVSVRASDTNALTLRNISFRNYQKQPLLLQDVGTVNRDFLEYSLPLSEEDTIFQLPDESGRVRFKMQFEENNLGASLDVTPDLPLEEIIKLEDLTTAHNVLSVWKISPSKQPDNPVTLRFYQSPDKPMPTAIYHFNGEEWHDLENMGYGSDDNGEYIEVKTTSFSQFAEVTSQSADPPAYTNYGMNTNLLMIISGLFLTGGVFLVRKEKKVIHQ